MAENEDGGERTEEPTQRRIDEALKRGQIVFSREAMSFIIFAVFALMVAGLLPILARNSIGELSRFITNSHDFHFGDKNQGLLTLEIIQVYAKITALPVALLFAAVLMVGFLQSGFNISGEPLVPKLEKISPMAGFKRIFSLKSFVEFVKGLLKIIVLGFSAYLICKSYINEIVFTPNLDISGIMTETEDVVLAIIIAATVFLMLISAIDYLYQKFEFLKGLRMTKQELKEEFKQTEGNPEIKAKLRQIREQRARKRMMSAVPKADVVIRNPTHYAIALQYEKDKMAAPKVVALGQDLIALTIIKLAEESKIPVVTNRNLAKALYETCNLDEEIPITHYKAVAEIIAYVFKLKSDKNLNNAA